MGFCYHLQRCCCAFTVIFPQLICYGFYVWAGYTYCYQIAWCHVGGFGGFLMGALGAYLTTCGIISYYLTVRLGAGLALDFPELRLQYAQGADIVNNSDNIYDNELSIGDLSDETVTQYVEKGILLPPPQQFLNNTYTIKASGNLRYCNKCKIWKPDRCHHCSTCKQCMLKMDHHCPWFANCIGYRNHKYFIQFLTYTVIYSAVCSLTTFRLLYSFFFDGEYLHHFFSLNWILMFIFGLAFFIAVGAFDAFLIYQMVTNRTTIETYDYTRYRIALDRVHDDYYKYSNKPNSDQYGNLFSLPSKKENWKYVMGTTWLEWCLPVTNKQPHSKDYYYKNGLCYPVNEAVHKELVYNARLQLQLATELQNYRMRRLNAAKLETPEGIMEQEGVV